MGLAAIAYVIYPLARCTPGPTGGSGGSRRTAAPIAFRPRSGTEQVSRRPRTAFFKLGSGHPNSHERGSLLIRSKVT